MNMVFDKLRTLIVDDEPLSLTVLQSYVEDDSRLKLIEAVDSAEKAQEVLKRETIHVIFLDVFMPGTTGIEFVKAMKDQKPLIVLISGKTEYALEAFELGVVDFLLKPIQPERFNKAVKRVLKNMKYTGDANDFESDILVKAIRFAYTRNKENFNAIPSRYSKLGYAYPFIAAAYGRGDEEKVLDLLKRAEDNSYLAKRNFVETSYACPNCYNAFLHYREVCPSCQSSNLVSEDLIHHFPCAHIGPMSDFQTDDTFQQLVCPKCEKTLRHIGVDYDKPSVINECRNCDKHFQDIMVYARCFSCETNVEVSHLHKNKIYNYAITSKGELAAMAGNIALDKVVDFGIQGVVSPETILQESYLNSFWSLTKEESNTMPRFIAALELANYEGLKESLGKEVFENLLGEIVQQIRSDLGVSDFVALPRPSRIVFSFFSPERRNAREYLFELVNYATILIKDNFSYAVDVSVKERLFPITKQDKLKSDLSALMTEFDD